MDYEIMADLYDFQRECNEYCFDEAMLELEDIHISECHNIVNANFL